MRRFQGVTLTRNTISYRPRISRETQPITGVTARVETVGGTDRRMTATRTLGGGLILGPLGLLLGGLAKKQTDNRETTLHIDGPTHSWSIPVNTNKISVFGGQKGYANRKRRRAQRFANRINTISRRAATGSPVPSPASVPTKA